MKSCEWMPRMLASCAMLAIGAGSTAANAQEPTATADAPAAATPTPGGGQVYTPEDFARYAPRNALDMLSQVPSFNIRGSDQQRGLGQATGNVLLNGQRPSSKSDDIFALLQRIPSSNVRRIEILDGAALDIPGLSGQVANVVFEASGLKGQFSWSPEFRAYNTDPLWTRGSVSITGKSGRLDYEAGIDNTNVGTGGANGLTYIYDGAGTLLESRNDQWQSRYQSPKLSGKLTLNAADGSVGHLNAHYQRIYDSYDETGFRQIPGEVDQTRVVSTNGDGWNYEIGGDYDFALGPGRLKAIGIRRFSHEPYLADVVTTYADGSVSTGDRFTQTGDLGETIGRAEYSWKMMGGDWQLAGEGAFNTLDNVASLFILDPEGDFVEVDFPGGTGGVSEDRYEGSLSFGRKITDKLSFQILAAAEHSTIVQTGINGLERSFFRPKGQVAFSWNPSDDLDLSFKLQRRVLQLSFYDFLARAFLNDDNENAGNNDLRPQQDWSVEGEATRKLGPWGSTKLRFVYRDVEDKVEVIPIEGGGEAVGNIPEAWAAAIVWENTINFDPAGIRGLKLESGMVFQTSSLRDPFTGVERQWSGFVTRQVNLSLRHDIPDSDWAWGASANHAKNQPSYRRDQIDRIWEGPWFTSLFVENKDVFGLTVMAQVSNLTNARSYRDRVIFEDLVGQSPVLVREERDRRIGPIFTLSVRGDF